METSQITHSLNPEAQITKDKNILLYNENIDFSKINKDEFDYICKHFCGTVTTEYGLIHDESDNDHNVYLCGDISIYNGASDTCCIIQELSYNYGAKCCCPFVTVGQVPLLLHGVGVFYRELFDDDLFRPIKTKHKFQSLTESNKPNNAFRKGIYLTEVTGGPSHCLSFHLLRCSSNFSGPTENFCYEDFFINWWFRYDFGYRLRLLNHLNYQLP